MLEWLKRHAWKACSRLKRLTGSNPVLSAETDHIIPINSSDNSPSMTEITLTEGLASPI